MSLDETGETISPEGVRIRNVFLQAGRVLAKYVRLEIDEGPGLPEPPMLVVLNHGFGTFTDPNALLAVYLMDRLGIKITDPAVMLTHKVAWTIGLGQHMETAGFQIASPKAALDGLSAGQPVFVVPGGEFDATKPWPQRNDVLMQDRSGFAAIAKEAGVPIVPIVITGAGDTVLNFTDGQWLARLLRLDRILGVRTAPISFALPWGFNVGLAMAGYLPWPAKMRAAVCDPITVADDEEPAVAAARVNQAMNERSHAMTDNRNPYLEWLTG